ncbi:MAG: hypothetical protein AAFY39_18870, partial [Pseudomonadota bacterium]
MLVTIAALVFAAPGSGGRMHDISQQPTNKKGMERASLCLAFIEAVKIYDLILKGLPLATGQDVGATTGHFDWVWTVETSRQIKALQAKGAVIDYAVASEFVTAFGPVGG